MPGHFYELLPIAVLIGAIFALARLAQSSEFTILRTGGLGPGRALALLTLLALGVRLCALTSSWAITWRLFGASAPRNGAQVRPHLAANHRWAAPAPG